jgi:thioredoxin-like negative regulator of GroEL
VIEFDPKNKEAHFNLANRLNNQGKFEEALQNY